MKILESSYINGHSVIVIQTASGTFTGHAKVHPEDKIIESRIIGWKIAEQRALTKYYKDQIKKETNKILGMEELYNIFKDDLDFIVEYEKLYHQHMEHIKYWKQQIQNSKKILEEIFNHCKKIKKVIYDKKS